MSHVSVEEKISQLRSPRAAALAGIIFSLLSFTVMFLVQDLVGAAPADISKSWLEENSSSTKFALKLVPFIGITFLWFTGVLREWLDHKEDRFFSTIFWSSGILVVGMLFIWASTFGAMINTYIQSGETLIGGGTYVFGHNFLREILLNYSLRMMGVYMMTSATIWRNTKVMPFWLTIITYGLGITFTLFSVSIDLSRFVFPVWVLLVSVYILVHNYREKAK